MRRSAAILALILPFVLLFSVEAKPRRTRLVRELVLHAETIVLAEPDPPSAMPTRFKVLEVLRGDGIKAGETLTLPTELPTPRIKPTAPKVEQALLFLGPNRGSRDKPRFEPIEGGYVPGEQRDNDWTKLVRQTRTDSDDINDLFTRKRLQPVGRRNRALLAWVENHRHDFGAPTTAAHPDKTAQGWGDLETRVFQWILDTCEPMDCWSAVKLYAELNRGAVPPLHEPAFGTRAGRALLLRMAMANDVLEGDRLRALTLLSHPLTLWARPRERLPQVRSLNAREQTDSIDRLTPLLVSQSAPLRAATARVLRCVSHPDGTAGEHPKSQRGLPALVKEYRDEPPGDARDELAEAIYVLGGAKRWQELTGNPAGVLVRLRDLERRDHHIHFWLSLRPGTRRVYERPTLLLERLDKANKVVEKKAMPLPVANLPKPWSAGWDGSSLLLVQFSAKDFKAGTWRVRVEGTAGKDKEKRKWTAEPKTFLVEPPPKPNAERRYYDKAK